MKRRLAIFAAWAVVGLYPMVGFCAEGQKEGDGSWLSFVFFIINFAIFAYVVVHYVGPLAGGFFRKRAGTIRETFRASDIAFKEADLLANRAAAEMARLEEDKASIVQDMRVETAREVERIKQLAQETAERIRRDGELSARATIREGRRRIQARLVQVATEMARQLIRASFNEADQARVLDEFVNRLSREARL